jgi:hypothetical protein
MDFRKIYEQAKKDESRIKLFESNEKASLYIEKKPSSLDSMVRRMLDYEYDQKTYGVPVVASIKLSKNDFEDLVSDFFEERDFIEQNGKKYAKSNKPSFIKYECEGNSKPPVYVDNQGYNYARYVGIDPDEYDF